MIVCALGSLTQLPHGDANQAHIQVSSSPSPTEDSVGGQARGGPAGTSASDIDEQLKRILGVSDQRLGLLYYAGASFCSSLMSISVRLASKANVPTWEIIFARSVVLAVAAAVLLHRAGLSPLGQRCARVPYSATLELQCYLQVLQRMCRASP